MIQIIAAETLSRAELDVLAERRRQISKGHSPRRDDCLAAGELAEAAAAYAHAGSVSEASERERRLGRYAERAQAMAWRLWPWAWASFRPRTPRDDLVRAAALCLAEIERLDRAAPRVETREAVQP